MHLIELQQCEPLLSTPQAMVLFKNFPAEQAVLLREYAPGTRIIQESELFTSVYVLLSGSVTSSWELPGRDGYVFNSNRHLEIMGDLAALAHLNYYTTSVTAATPCKVLQINGGVFAQWMRQEPDLMATLSADNLQMLLKQNHHRRMNAEYDPRIRIEKYLLWYCDLQLGQSAHFPISVKKTRENMVQDINLISLRTINRILALLKQEQSLSVIRGKVHITQTQYAKLKSHIEATEAL